MLYDPLFFKKKRFDLEVSFSCSRVFCAFLMMILSCWIGYPLLFLVFALPGIMYLFPSTSFLLMRLHVSCISYFFLQMSLGAAYAMITIYIRRMYPTWKDLPEGSYPFDDEQNEESPNPYLFFYEKVVFAFLCSLSLSLFPLSTSLSSCFSSSSSCRFRFISLVSMYGLNRICLHINILNFFVFLSPSLLFFLSFFLSLFHQPSPYVSISLVV